MTQTLFQPAKLWEMIAILNGIHILSSKILETVTMQHLDYLVQKAIKPNYLLKQKAPTSCVLNQINRTM